MKKKNITIDDLARMVHRGFDETSKKKDVDKQFSVILDRLEKIEKLMLANHKMRIERLEIEVRELKDLLSVK